jgi:hypothetical protein
MQAEILDQLKEFLKKEVSSTQLAQVLRKTDFELINLVLSAPPDNVDRNLIANSHFFLHKLADILDPPVSN